MEPPKKYDDIYGGKDDGTVAGSSNVTPIEEARTRKPKQKVSKPSGDVAPSRTLPSPKEPLKVARVLVDEEYSNGHLLMRSWRGGLWEWTGTHWTEVEQRQVESDAYAFTEHAIYIDGKSTKPWAPNRYKVADLLDALRAITHLRENIHPPAWIGATTGPPARELVACTNGLLHVPTRELLPHDPRLFNVVAVPFAYDQSTPPPERWLHFLGQLWPEDTEAINALQEYFGYVISGDTSQHKILLLIGPRRGGKGTIARILKALVGDGNHAGPTLASLGTNFGLQPLIGKPLAIISDARLGGANVHQVVERLLSISGEDMLTIDRKYREHWTGTLPTRFFIISNELPRFGDASGAIASRFILLTLSESWLGRENTALTDELLGELPSIFNWALDGLARLQEQSRFTKVPSSEDALGALQDLVSPVSAFVRDRCELGPFDVEVETIYDSWKQWAEDNGHKVTSVQTFGRDLRAVLPGLRTARPRHGQDRKRAYHGIRLHGSGSRTIADQSRGGPHGPQSRPMYPQAENDQEVGAA